MRCFPTGLSIALVFETVLTGVLARDCLTNDTFSEVFGSYRLFATTPDQLAALDGCTTLSGDIYIESAFSGAFTLNDVTNFTGRIFMDGYDESHDMTSFEMLEVVYVKSLAFLQTWGLRSIRMPKLERIDELHFIQSSEESSYDLPALKSAGTVYAAGDWPNITFNALESAESIFLSTDPPSVIPRQASPAEVHLPVLQSVVPMAIRGHVKDFRAPRLRTIGTPGPLEPHKESGMSVQANYTSMSGIYLTELRELYGQLNLQGHMKGLNLGLLQSTDATIRVRAQSPMNIYLPLEKGGIIDLSGELASVEIWNLGEAEEIHISSSHSFHCAEALLEIYQELNHEEPTFCSNYDSGPSPSPSLISPPPFDDDQRAGTNSESDLSSGAVSEGGGRSSRTGSLSNGDRTAIIVVCVLFVAGASVTGLCWYRNRRKRAQQTAPEIQQQQSDAPQQPSDAVGESEAPPPYSARPPL